jgi:hypothetical protein
MAHQREDGSSCSRRPCPAKHQPEATAWPANRRRVDRPRLRVASRRWPTGRDRERRCRTGTGRGWPRRTRRSPRRSRRRERWPARRAEGPPPGRRLRRTIRGRSSARLPDFDGDGARRALAESLGEGNGLGRRVRPTGKHLMGKLDGRGGENLVGGPSALTKTDPFMLTKSGPLGSHGPAFAEDA